MTHEQIEELIDLLNSEPWKAAQHRIYLTPIAPLIDVAKVWCEEPRGGICNEDSYRFFFIKNDAGSYVSAILDMHNDLHAFTKSSNRGYGHASRAMGSVILPLFWQEGRKTQRVTFGSSPDGRRVATRLGFKQTGDNEAEKDLSVYAPVATLQPHKRPLSKEDLQALKLSIDRAKLYLKMAQEQLEVAYGDEVEDLELDSLIYNVIGRLNDDVLESLDVIHRRLRFPPVFGY